MRIRLIQISGFAFLLVVLLGCEKLGNTMPEASFTCSPDYGDIETVFVFDASASFDEETDDWRLKVRWDANDDGTWDSDYSVIKEFGFKYASEGNQIVRLEVLDAYGGISQTTDTIVVGPVVKDSVMVDPRDGQEYDIVRLYGSWWMAENLRYGSRMDGKDFCEDNGLTEYYSMIDTISGEDMYGAFYTWNEASDYERDEIQGICPEGWHLIGPDDLNTLKSLLEKAEKKYEYYRDNGIWHLNLHLHGRYFWPNEDWDDLGTGGYIWYARVLPFPKYSAWVVYQTGEISSSNDFYNPSWVNNWKPEWLNYTFQKIAMPVRCVKN